LPTLAALWVAKKAAFYGLGTLYGWPRVYRRVLEQSVKFNGKGSDAHARVADRTKRLFRLPNRLAASLKQPPPIAG